MMSSEHRREAVLRQLRELGDPRDPWRDGPETLDYPAKLGLTDEDIAHLIAVLERWALPDEQLDEAEREEPGVYAPIHAWRTLGQLRAVEAVEPMLAMLDELDERMDDWSLEEFPVVWALIGEPAIEPLGEYLADRAHRDYARICTASGLRKMAQRHPETRERVVELLTRQLDEPVSEPPQVNGFVIAALLDLRAKESAVVIEQAYAAEAVNLTICGNWASVRDELGVEGTGLISEEQARTRPPHLLPPPLPVAGSTASSASPAAPGGPDETHRRRERRKRERRNRRRSRRR